MNYFLFEKGDVVGPFPAQELKQRDGFAAASLVCPQDHSEEEEYWKAAQEYEDFGFAAPTPEEKPAPAATESKTETFGPAMAVAVQDMAPLTDVKTDLLSFGPARQEQVSEQPSQTQEADAPELKTEEPEPQEEPISISQSLDRMEQILVEEQAQTSQAVAPSEEKNEGKTSLVAVTEVMSQTISQVSPIEEYFNTMRSGDLGNILGMPDPNANSDMNLASVLEKQFEKTDPNVPSTTKTDPFEEFVQLHDQESEVGVSTPDAADQQTEVQLQQDLEQPKRQAVSASQTVEQKEEPQTASERDSMQTLTDSSSKNQPCEELVPQTKQADSMPVLGEDDTEQEWMNPPAVSSQRKWFTLALVLMLLLGVAYEGWVYRDPLATWVTQVVTQLKNEAKKAAAPSDAVKSAPTPAPAPALVPSVIADSTTTKTPEEQAKQIAQQYPLDKGRGTVAEYLSKRYAKELASGYASSWSAEPLHKNVYVVKYRLAKTRKEPIVYIFQVDTSKNKLTGALNNITLDLVGKIN